MKLNAALAKSLLMAASIGMVVPVLADTTVVPANADATTTPPKSDSSRTLVQQTVPRKPAATKPTSVKPAKGTAADAAKKADVPEPEPPGILQSRPNGGFLGLEIEGGKFKISFYDKEKKPVNADVVRGSARWDTHRKIHQDRTMLNLSGDGRSLQGVEVVSPPYTFIVFITLLDADGNAVESYSIQMH